MSAGPDLRATAEALMTHAETLPIGNPYRVDAIARASVYALLALGKPEPALQLHVTELPDLSHAGEQMEALVQTAKRATAPRKRAARKTTTPKETSK